MRKQRVSTEVASSWITRWKNEMSNEEFKKELKEFLTETTFYQPSYDKEGSVFQSLLREEKEKNE